MGDDAILRITVKNTYPIDLNEYATALNSIADDFRLFCKKENKGFGNNTRLYIKEVSKGSIITDLTTITAGALPVIVDNAELITEYGKFLFDVFNWLLGKKEKPEGITQKNLSNIGEIVNINNSDIKGSLNFNIYIDGKNIAECFLNNIEQNAIQNRARKESENIKELKEQEFKDAVLKWEVAKNGDKSSFLDKGIIESISQNPTHIITTNDKKEDMLNKDIFNNYFIVDGKTKIADGKIIAYQISDIKDIFPKNG